LKRAPSLYAARKQLDPPNGEAITEEKVTARIKQWQDSKVGRLQVVCKVTRNKQPLAGATVTFEPEKFLGEGLPIGTGTTDEMGTASISVPPSGSDSLPGMPPGLYLVRITKSGENIPAKFNTETTLGQEVAQDAEGTRTGVKFDLAY
jgi:hypothetical protein